MRSQWVVCAAVAASVLLCNPVRGDLSYYVGVDQSNYAVPPSQSVDVPVYLHEAVTAPDVSLLVTEGGLFSAGVSVSQASTTTGDPASVTGVWANTTDFDFTTTSLSPSSIYGFSSLGVFGDETSPGVRRILLGVFTLTTGATVGEVTTFDVTTRGGTLEDMYTMTGLAAFDSLVNSTQFTVTAEPVPVPPAVLLGLLGLGAGGIGLWRERARLV
jgi:hypothetical protein